ncbi:hypothetical protein SDC9_193425 [bioreactor metagenome]|uniref:Uncharacterized protein n=1 Tax=bioreactor metagenome TaxID=1076179 RepID=A0A645I404_9ZZZZ
MVVQKPLQYRRNRKRIGEPDQGFYLAKFRNLHCSAELAKTICAMDCRGYFLQKNVPCVRANHAHTGVNSRGIVMQRAVSYHNPVHIGDAVSQAGLIIARHTHPVPNPLALHHAFPLKSPFLRVKSARLRVDSRKNTPMKFRLRQVRVDSARLSFRPRDSPILRI